MERFSTFAVLVRSVSSLVLLGGLAACGTSDRLVVRTTEGDVRGSENATTRSFLGIPYAAPPVGDLRWRAPQPPANRSGVRDATTFASHCAQPISFFGTASTSEDCLYLNVYTPKTAGSYPVMVWLHGGALFLGESDDYDPTPLVGQGLVVVTINYRLGALGFMSHPALTAEQGGSGNYGLMDQQAALRWIQNNIANFGGDPRNVTLFGQSAGGLSVHAQLASSTAAGLFHKAIVQSGAYSLDQPTLAQAEAQGSAIATAAGCTNQTTNCLRGLSVDAVLNAQSTAVVGFGFIPSVDTRVLTRTVRDALTTGAYNLVPVVEGSTHDEWRLLVAQTELLTGTPLGEAGYVAAIQTTLGITSAEANNIAALYPASAYPNPSVALGAIGTDAIFACSARAAARLLSSRVVTYTYEFNDPDAPQIFQPAVSFSYGATHTSELKYLFTLRGPALSSAQRGLADAMVRYWARFARSGDLNTGSDPAWPAYASGTDQTLSLAPGAIGAIGNFATDHQCGVWTPGI
jgi:para-nitrobenzyl esterase